MKDLKAHVLISEDTAHTIITILRLISFDNKNELVDATIASLEKALNQDLSGMVVVPLEPTDKMAEAHGENELYCKEIYKAMLSAAKEKNDD